MNVFRGSDEKMGEVARKNLIQYGITEVIKGGE